jgi:hypothetical protein
LCIFFLGISFSFFFLFNELPRENLKPSQIQNPHSGTFLTEEQSRFGSPPIQRIDATDVGTDAEPLEPHKGEVLGLSLAGQGEQKVSVIEPNVPTNDQIVISDHIEKVLSDSSDIKQDILNNELAEEKLREQIVAEDPTWVSWQKMNQVRYLSLLTGKRDYNRVLLIYLQAAQYFLKIIFLTHEIISSSCLFDF